MNAIYRWLEERIDLSGMRKALLDREVPDNLTWMHTLGSAAAAAFTVQIVTGVVLAMYYAPSPDHAYDSIRYLDSAIPSGALLRGMHHWGASAMVLLVGAHMIRVFTMGAYKYPREANWLVGVGLFALVMGFGFTGYLLPWDQKAFWATEVGTNIAGTMPLFGAMMVKLLRGGSQLGAATLTRFFALHVLLLPLLTGSLIAVHLVMVVRQGIAPVSPALEKDSPKRTDSKDYPAYYKSRYAGSKTKGTRFWPDVIAKDLAVAAGMVVILFILASAFGAGLELPADPSDASYVPRPEWYFLPFFQLLKLVPGSMEAVVAIGVPGALMLALLGLPFYDRNSNRSIRSRPVAALSLGAVLGATALLLGASLREDSIGAVAPEAGRALTAVERAGRSLFKAQQCGGCHQVGDQKVKKTDDTPDAPDLTKVGLKHSSSWMHSFMEDPMKFHPDSKMPAFGPPKLSHQEIEELARYLSTLRGPMGNAAQPEYRDTFPEPIRKDTKATTAEKKP
jgi:ubiquinol-cytochrome c reductase cytochrome b subunit